MLQNRREKVIFCIYIGLFFLIATSIACVQPHLDTPLLSNPPDETYRYLVPRFIAEHGSIPNGFEPEIRMDSYGISYAFYTYFPYVIQGYIMRLVHIFTDSELVLLLTGRMVNVFFGVAMCSVVYQIAKLCFQGAFRWLFCFLVMFLPQQLFIHTYVNTDSLCMLSTAVIVWMLLLLYQKGFTVKRAIVLAIGISLCALSYYNAYGFILCSIFLVAGYFIHVTENDGKKHLNIEWKGLLFYGSLIAGVVILLTAWYFIRNGVLYQGDILGMRAQQECASQYAWSEWKPENRQTFQSQGYSVFRMLRETDFFTALYISFIGAFGAVSITGNIWMYRLYKLVIYSGLACFAFLPVREKKEGKNQGLQRSFFCLNMLLCMVIPVFLCVVYSYTSDFQNQGRYILPMLVPLMLFITTGFQKVAVRFSISEKPVRIITGIILVLLMAGLLQLTYGVAYPIYLLEGPVL